ncbi:MAG: hypothetical protein OXF20_10715 [Gammaproteobacteria bacterium]|nr:hypothetical protein [Gammaproteobacteria bacterium]
MKNWRFPFTDYDFYAYLAIGLVILVFLGYAITGCTTDIIDDWSYRQIAFAVVIAYMVEQINAGTATVVVDTILFRNSAGIVA